VASDDGLKVVATMPSRPIASHDTPGVVVQIDAGKSGGKAGAVDVVYGRTPASTAPGDKNAAPDVRLDTIEEAPPEPISTMMMAFLQSVWQASGNAIDAALARQQALATPNDIRSGGPNGAPDRRAENDRGTLGTVVEPRNLRGQSAELEPTYSPVMIKKAAAPKDDP
jgi:hypothetical protein